MMGSQCHESAPELAFRDSGITARLQFERAILEPANRAIATSDLASLSMEPTKTRPLILIADDNVQNVELLEAYLAEVDCETINAFDGDETLQVVKERRPDLVLLDVMMPKLSGFEVCRTIRNDPEIKDTLILIVTALNEAADFERGVQAGTDDFLTKPVNKVELLCRVKSMLRVRHLKLTLDRTLAYLSEVEQLSRG